MANVSTGNSVTASSQLSPNVVTNEKMADNAIKAAEIEAGAVATSEILDETVLNADIAAAAAIALSKLAAGTHGGVMIRTTNGVMTELPQNTAGKVLVTQGPNQDPIWATVGGGTAGYQSIASSVTGTTVFAHGLGRAPTAMTFMGGPSSGITGNTNGTWMTGQTGQGHANFNGGSTSYTTGAVIIGDATSGSTNVGSITVDTTNVTITWSKTGGPTTTFQINWFAV